VADDGRAGHRYVEACGCTGAFCLQPLEDAIDGDPGLAGNVRAIQPGDRQHRLLRSVGAGADQARADHRRAMRFDLPDTQTRTRLRELIQISGDLFDKAEVRRRHTSMRAFVNQDKLRARRIRGKAANQEVVPDHAQRVRRKEPDIVVFGDLLPARRGLVQARRGDEPTEYNNPRTTNHKTR
jgi:hypothetical protein